MAFAAVVLVSKGKQIRGALPFLHAPQQTEMVVARLVSSPGEPREPAAT